MRKVVLDTETTGLNRKRNGSSICKGHRIVEIGPHTTHVTDCLRTYLPTYLPT